MTGPIDAFRLAVDAGYEIEPVSGSVCVSLVGNRILYDGREEVDQRDRHAAVARVLAGVMLYQQGVLCTPENIDATACDIMIPESFADDVVSCDGDLEQLERMHPHVSYAWLARSVELRANNVVPFKARRATLI